MTAHLHTVMKLEQSVGGMSWFQYDWRARRETCGAGASLSWGRRDPWQLLTCMPESSGRLDPLDPLPQGLKAERHQILTQPKSRQPANQTKPGTTQRRQGGGVFRLYNRAPAGCPYGEGCIFIHQSTQCRRPALTMGRRTVRMENTMTLVHNHNDKEDITLVTVIPGPPTLGTSSQLLIKQPNLC